LDDSHVEDYKADIARRMPAPVLAVGLFFAGLGCVGYPGGHLVVHKGRICFNLREFVLTFVADAGSAWG
jgi:hypothetical protein